MTEAQYALVGFIDTAATREVLEAQLPRGVWRAKPRGDMAVPGRDIILVLHVSQLADNNKRVAEYVCFNVCVEAIAQGRWDDQRFAGHLSWIRNHRERIRAIVLTSGGYVSLRRASAARQQLEGSGIEVLGWNVRELAGRLKQCAGFTRTSEFLRCLAGDTAHESALRLLSALLPFGLLWEAQGEGGRAGLVGAARSLNDELFGDFERVLVARVKEHLSGQPPQGWEPSGFEHNAAQLDELLSRAPASGESWERAGCEPAPTNLDSAIKALAESESFELWNARLAALRDSLLGSHA